MTKREITKSIIHYANWPFIPHWQFRRDYNPLDWNYTTATKQKDKKKYKLYWSARYGGLWVRME